MRRKYWGGLFVADGERATAVGVGGDVDAHCLVGQEGFDEFGPLDEAGLVAIEVVFVADVVCFGEGFDAVEVEVVDASAGLGQAVFVDDGKGGRAGGVGDAELFADGIDEGGFASTHAAVEGEDAVLVYEGDEFACGALDVVEVVYSDGLGHGERFISGVFFKELKGS